ncbi:MAG: hypothetical protein IBX55_15955 [Methyloprofundus sp.]|nr:hypothetical protein [Methyloprofundus sp.]
MSEAKFICRANVDGVGDIEIWLDRRGVRLYGISDRLGQVPFQKREAQQILRDAVIDAGFGKLIGADPVEPETMPEPEPETPPGLVVVDKPETPVEKKTEKSGSFWGWGEFFKKSEGV